jgi:hypothetical protein
LNIFDNIKNIISGSIINKELKKKENDLKSFNGSFKKAFNIFVIMPQNETDFHHCFEVLKFLEQNKKHIVIFLNDFRVSLLPQSLKSKAFPFNVNDINKLNLPGKPLMQRIQETGYSAVINLNREENVLFEYVSFIIDAPLKVGFKKHNSDKYYNLQFINTSEDADISYKNLVNCLQMF